jgi:hypothetical protein
MHEPDGQLWLVNLTVDASVLALTRQANLDALGLDDRISTGRLDIASRADPDPLLELCGRLADGVYDWWNGSPPPLLYRSRTMPGIGRNLAFTATVPTSLLRARPLREATALHTYLVLRAGFTVPDSWLHP